MLSALMMAKGRHHTFSGILSIAIDSYWIIMAPRALMVSVEVRLNVVQLSLAWLITLWVSLI